MAEGAASDSRVEEISNRHGFSAEAGRAMLGALRRSHGTMAQFNHPELGGLGQWSSGMIMIGEMGNDSLKQRVAALASDLASEATFASSDRSDASETGVQPGQSAGSGDWWPANLGQPSTSGTQNNMAYAYFPEKRRLAIRDRDSVRLYDTGDERIGGAAQAQGYDRTLTFTTDRGTLDLNRLRRVDD